MNNGTHLTEDQIDDHLIGDLAAEPAAHLAACSHCQFRVQEMENPIASFKAVSLAWSERQSATMPLKPDGFAKSAQHHHRSVWAATAAAALLVGIAVPVVRHYSADNDTLATNATSAPLTMADTHPSREDQIASDNRMLQAIDRELSSASSDNFGLEAVSSAGRAHAAQLRN